MPKTLFRIAREHAELRGLPPAHVSIFFNLRKPLNHDERLDLGRRIAGLVVQQFPREEEGFVELDSLESGDLFPLEVDRLHIHRHSALDVHHWHTVDAGWVLRDCMDILQTAITSKAIRHPTYMRSCDECWLLIVAEGSSPSCAIRPNEESLVYEYSSPFERTYFMRCVDRKLFRLKQSAT